MNKWVVLYGDTHTHHDNLDDASNLIQQLLKQNQSLDVKLIRLEDYLISDARKRKRGKKS